MKKFINRRPYLPTILLRAFAWLDCTTYWAFGSSATTQKMALFVIALELLYDWGCRLLLLPGIEMLRLVLLVVVLHRLVVEILVQPVYLTVLSSVLLFFGAGAFLYPKILLDTCVVLSGGRWLDHYHSNQHRLGIKIKEFNNNATRIVKISYFRHLYYHHHYDDIETGCVNKFLLLISDS